MSKRKSNLYGRKGQFRTKLIGLEEVRASTLKALNDKKPVLLYGPSGVGKTALAEEIAVQKKWRLMKINSSDSRTKSLLESNYRLMRTKPVKKLLFLLDEVDGFYDWNYLKKMLVNCQHPVIMTANEEWKIKKWVFTNPKTKRKFVKEIKVWAPRRSDLTKILEKKGIKGDFSKLGSKAKDIRSSELIMRYGSEGYEDLSPFDKIKQMINNPNTIINEINEIGSNKFWKQWCYWFLHNLPIFHRGYSLYEAMEIVSQVDLSSDPTLLKFLPEPILGGKGQKPEYPSFFKIRKKYWQEEQKKKRVKK